MKYIKSFKEAYVPYGDYLIGDNVQSKNKVKNFIEYFKLSNSILNIWKGMVERYETYPLKIDKDSIMYRTQDNYIIKIKYNTDVIQNMVKYKKNLSNGTQDVAFEGKYTWAMFETLFLGQTSL